MARPVRELRDQYSWAALGSAKVVDVGGGNGHVSRGLAEVSYQMSGLYRRLG